MMAINPYLRQADKICLNCDEPYNIGRIDKKFCNDACRIDFNNKIKAQKRIELPDFAKTIPKIIQNNYRIMRKLNTSGKTKVTREQLDKMGFNFNFITSYHTTQKGVTYHFCFDQGYLVLEDGKVLLVVQPSEVLKAISKTDL